MKKKNILYIHGLGSGFNSRSSLSMKKHLSDCANIITFDFDHHCKDMLDRIAEIVVKEKIDIMVGTSLGGFYTLATDFKGLKIAVNPAQQPHHLLMTMLGTHKYFCPRLDGEKKYTITEADAHDFEGVPLLLTDNTYCIMSRKDDLLGDCVEEIKERYEKANVSEDHVIITDIICHSMNDEFIGDELKKLIIKLR